MKLRLRYQTKCPMLSEDDCAHSIETWNEMLISPGERFRTLMYPVRALGTEVGSSYAWKVLLKAYGKMNHFWVLTFCTGRGKPCGKSRGSTIISKNLKR